MQNVYYSVIGIMAIIVHIIINKDQFFKDEKPDEASHKVYRRFLISVLCYFIADASWGIASAINHIPITYIDTIILYLVMAFSVVLWCRYVVVYLNLDDMFGKIINICGICFYVAEIIMLIINCVHPILFSINKGHRYSVYYLRYVLLIVQIILYMFIALQSTYVAVKSSNRKKKRHITIAIYGYELALAVLGQTFFPLLPVYTMGLMIGMCLLHVFVQEDEKDDYRNELMLNQAYLENATRDKDRQINTITELNRTLSEHNEIIASAGMGIWYIIVQDDAPPRMQPNDKMRELLGIEGQDMSEEEIYDSWYDNIVPSAIPSVINSVNEMKEGKYSENTYKWMHPTKGEIYVRCGGTAKKIDIDTYVISGFHMDCTESVLDEQRQKEALEKATRAAESANQAKTTFLFNMSHDIRTPMNAITGYTELLKKNLGDVRKSREYIDKIQSSSQFLLSLINNVLEMARIESGKAVIDEEIWDAEEFNDTIMSVFEEQMKNKEITFSRTINVKNSSVYCDPVKLREIYLNLLSNAMKYTPAGGSISLDLEELPSDKKGYTLFRTRISDTGIGMSKEFLPRLFEEFSREHTVTENKVEGTGLGMPIVKKLVELMDGTIEVESELGVGTTFTVTMYHRIANDTVKKNVSKENRDYSIFSGKRILLAEDNDLNAEIAIEILGEAGFRVERATDGIVCVDMLQKSEGNYYDAILMDIQMPNMDGYKATQIIRKMDNIHRRDIPILAMTANAFEEDKKNALDAGMNGHLAKPIDITQLMETLYTFLK